MVKYVRNLEIVSKSLMYILFTWNCIGLIKNKLFAHNELRNIQVFKKCPTKFVDGVQKRLVGEGKPFKKLLV
jgi:hypothetical protein